MGEKDQIRKQLAHKTQQMHLQRQHLEERKMDTIFIDNQIEKLNLWVTWALEKL